MSDKPQILVSVPFDQFVAELVEQLKPVVAEAVQKQMPDQLITSIEAKKILGVSLSTIGNFIDDQVLNNYGTGSQRPKLSKKEVIDLQKRIVNNRLQKAV